MTTQKTEEAAFGAGCFWGVEETFRQIDGVLSTEVGYMGGTIENPSYEAVCAGFTGHAETVHLTFDPAVLSYETLLDVFWNNHNPTTKNQQGPDIGEQYRSVIFTYSKEQEEKARASLEAMEQSGKFSRPIVTEIVPASTFWRGEDYHQRYLQKRGLEGCHI